MRLLGILSPAKGKSVLFLGLLVSRQVLLNVPHPGPQGIEVLGGTFGLLHQLFAPGTGLSNRALLLSQQVIALVQGTQGGEGPIKLLAPGLR